MDDAQAVKTLARHVVSDRGSVVWARSDHLRRSRRSRAEPGTDPGGDGPRLPEDGPEWKRRAVNYMVRHKVIVYLCTVTSVTLVLLVLQLAAGFHR